ncbi:hypothetical protein KTT_49710 [Tengunoibacter tsumagoiensis]|uniref:Uncharacterized protein n=1 Tax=Tengunoibacter tsumagoiensis TaxID=2014871 RepID=A0A402A7K0_9CHLR|nr:hypothetical protein KTT_49710 [Tengunoibacter tsumagoiensis]
MATNILRAIYRDPYREVATTTINKLAKALAVPVNVLIEDVSEDFAEQEWTCSNATERSFPYMLISKQALSTKVWSKC